ncbi:MAG: sugar ABC transporter permease [Ruthenibacterium sp.]
MGKLFPKKKKFSMQKESSVAAILFLAPAVIMLLIWFVYPLLQSFYISFQDFNYMFKDRAKFVGLDNYVALFKDPDFFKAFWHSIWFVVLVVPVQSGLALLLAVLVNSKMKGKGLCAVCRGCGNGLYVFFRKGCRDGKVFCRFWYSERNLVCKC